MGSIATPAQLSVAMGTTAPGKPESFALPPLLLLGSLGLGLGKGVGLQIPPPIFSQFHLPYMFQFTCFYMYEYMKSSSILVCWEEAPLLSFSYFTGCKFKGGDISLYHDADITLLQFLKNIYFSCFGW